MGPKAKHKIKKLLIPTAEGESMVELLHQNHSLEQTTTHSRQEKKATLPFESYEYILSHLEGKSIHFKDRDLGPKNEENINFTFYGRGAKFLDRENKKTSINLRFRIYLHRKRVGKRTFIYSRAPLTLEQGFLEIKVKGPSAKAGEIVHKFRILLRDQDLIALVFKNTHSLDYPRFLESLAKKAKAIPQNTDPGLVDAIFKSIERLTGFDPLSKDFNRYPIVSYVRQAKEFTDLHYPFGGADKKVQYQLTVDQQIQIFRPAICKSHRSLMPEEYLFGKLKPNILGHYPENSRVLEFKTPSRFAALPMEKRSATHRLIARQLSVPMEELSMLGFLLNKGKSFHSRRFVTAQILSKGSNKKSGIIADASPKTLLYLRIGLDRGFARLFAKSQETAPGCKDTWFLIENKNLTLCFLETSKNKQFRFPKTQCRGSVLAQAMQFCTKFLSESGSSLPSFSYRILDVEDEKCLVIKLSFPKSSAPKLSKKGIWTPFEELDLFSTRENDKKKLHWELQSLKVLSELAN